ncbi:MAG: metallophosphoesterase [Tissierellia bacterium]|nr:metallophosphoesterase [Tissierellia bacterium]
MRIFVVSDTHGNTIDFINKVNSMKKPELFIHLGDYVEDGEKIEKKTGVETVIVKGNGDYFHPKYNEDEILNIKGKTLLLTHGHNHGVRYGIDRLLYKAYEVGADLVLFGHTHLPFFHEEDGIILVNPGSASMPRGFNRKKTFGIIDIDNIISVEIVSID